MISIVIRTLNEEKYLGECLKAVKSQLVSEDVEIVVVDSGSSDRTIEIAQNANVKLVEIKKSEFTFGRSLNWGTQCCLGDIVVYLSAHCIPIDEFWLSSLIAPLREGEVSYSYGRQLPLKNISKFSEGKVFEKYFPSSSAIPQKGYFCNNANAAIMREVWSEYKFDEDLTGLEDMELAKRLVQDGKKIGYVSCARVAHIHEEAWHVVRKRYEREAIALSQIDPALHIGYLEAVFLVCNASIKDGVAAIKEGQANKIAEIFLYRYNQFMGSYRGSRLGRLKVKVNKIHYFYPNSKCRF